MKSWESIEKTGFGRRRPDAWKTETLILINKHYTVFSPKLMENFVKDSRAVEILYVNTVKDGRFLGIKAVPRGEEKAMDFSIQTTDNKKDKKIMLPKKLMQQLKDILGQYFRASKDPKSNIIECDLNSPIELTE